MLCADPFSRGNVDFPCGQCNPCRINRRRLWALRIYLESLTTKPALFCTLTYREPGPSQLVPSDVRNFMKRLRRHVETPIRYFACGEYGENTFRPHYHIALFGLTDPSLVGRCWSHGFVDVQEMSFERAMYLSGYVVKKLTSRSAIDAVPALKGKQPEFSRMSLKPGIGALAMEKLLTASYQEMKSNGDVVSCLTIRGESLPLGRYLRSVLRDLCQLPEDHSKAVAYADSFAFATIHPTYKEWDSQRAARSARVGYAAEKERFFKHVPKPSKGTL